MTAPNGSARESQQDALEQHLTNDAPAARAESRAHGQFAASRRRVGQEQVGDVGTRNQQHEADAAEEHRKHQLRITGIDQGHDVRRHAGDLTRMFLDKIAIDRIDLALRLADRNVRPQAADEAKHAQVAALHEGLSQTDGRPHLGPLGVGERRRTRGPPERFLLGQEVAAEHRLHTKDVEHVGRKAVTLYGFGRPLAREVVAGVPRPRRVGERLRSTPPVEEIRRPHRDVAGFARLLPLPDHDQLSGFLIEHSLQQHRVDDAEDRGVGADAERECGNDDDGKRRPAGERAQRVAKVLAHGASLDAQRDGRVGRTKEPRNPGTLGTPEPWNFGLEKTDA